MIESDANGSQSQRSITVAVSAGRPFLVLNLLGDPGRGSGVQPLQRFKIVGEGLNYFDEGIAGLSGLSWLVVDIGVGAQCVLSTMRGFIETFLEYRSPGYASIRWQHRATWVKPKST
jgi:hypothetical protein